ncbi:MAG TPA: pirin family protein [Tissierellia bacterium]|jgi:redox-sensitive bicupin YhaK (pirin superfamily)|nr:pirin family protein [Tissierellia bacterium]
MNRSIERKIAAPEPHWVGSGFRVRQLFPKEEGLDWHARFSPFLLMDYHEPYYYEATPFEVGVGPHAHRGFSTLTISLAGRLSHEDNAGNKGTIHSGGVQWMHAGKGILHKEMHEERWSKNPRVLHCVQLWIDSPKDRKFDEPAYRSFSKEDLGTREFFDETKLTVIIGEAYGVKGPVPSLSPINLYYVRLSDLSQFSVDEPADHHVGLLVLDGEVRINDSDRGVQGDFFLLSQEEGTVTLEADSFAEVLVLSGKPLDQEVYMNGPFAMATKDDLYQALSDLQLGKFGSMEF